MKKKIIALFANLDDESFGPSGTLGSLFWQGLQYKETLQKWTNNLAHKYRANFIKIEDSSIVGGAKI